VSRKMGRIGLGAAACWAALTALSSGAGAQPSSPLPSVSRTSAALSAWSHFPVHESPRPLVLIDGDNVNAPALGFPSDDTKAAYDDGDITRPSSFPTGPWSVAGFPLVSSQSAFNTLKGAALSGPPATTALVVTSVNLGTSVFQTDRGQRTLPAWLFSFQGVQNPAQVLAVAPSRIFTPRRVTLPDAIPESSLPVGSATLASDHRTLTVEVAGAPEGTGPCEATYSLRTGASKKAVAVAVDQVVHYKSGVGCLLQGALIPLDTKLAKPLGNRVVVDAYSATAVPVTS
jgi:hypothetical protein